MGASDPARHLAVGRWGLGHRRPHTQSRDGWEGRATSNHTRNLAVRRAGGAGEGRAKEGKRGRTPPFHQTRDKSYKLRPSDIITYKLLTKLKVQKRCWLFFIWYKQLEDVQIFQILLSHIPGVLYRYRVELEI